MSFRIRSAKDGGAFDISSGVSAIKAALSDVSYCCEAHNKGACFANDSTYGNSSRNTRGSRLRRFDAGTRTIGVAC